MLTFEEFKIAYFRHMLKLNHESDDIIRMLIRFREGDYWYQYNRYIKWYQRTH